MRRRLPHVSALVALCAAGAAGATPSAVLPPTSGKPLLAPLKSTSVVFVAPKAGARVKGITTLRVRAPAATQWVGLYACKGNSAGEDTVRDQDGSWSVQWNTRMRGCANGSWQLGAFAFNDAGDQLGEGHVWVTIRNTAQRRKRPPPRPGPCRAAAAPRPIAHQGYKQRFGDCFGTLNRRVWCSHQWFEPAPRIGTQYVDKRGVLHLVRRRGDGYPDNTISSEPCGQAAPKSFTYGYFEARMRWTGVPGSGPAFWLLSTRHATNRAWPDINPYCAKHGLPAARCYSSELDVFEGYGNHRGVFTGTIHRNSCNCYGVDDEQNPNSWQPRGSHTNLAARWHVYAAKWTAKRVFWYLDGRLIMSTAPYDALNQPMHLLFYNWNTDWEPGNDVGPSTPRELQTEVDWMRVWQRR